MSTPSSASALSLHDARPLFEKALAYGVQHGIIGPDKISAINTEAPKGMVQIARYFGSEHLRPDLEKARERIVNLVSLYLQETTGGDLQAAAQSLREYSLLSRSKGGSDLLKKLIAMPQISHFGMHERGGFTDDQIPLLAKWSLQSHAQYRTELAKRLPVHHTIEAALWFAQRFGLDADDLEEAGTDAEAVIRTALLLQALAPKATEWPDAVAFEKMLTSLGTQKALPSFALPAPLPAPLHAAAEVVRQSLLADLPRLRNAGQPLGPLLHTPAFVDRYFWIEDPLAEVDHYHRSCPTEAPSQPGSALWQKLTQGQDDEHSLLTLLVCLAAGSPRKTLLTEKTAASLVRKLRKTGLHPERATEFIHSHAPSNHQEAYDHLWSSFLEDAHKTLTSDLDYQLHDALALLRRECNVRG